MVLLVKVTCENDTPLPLCMYTAAPDAVMPSNALLAKLTRDNDTLEQARMANAPPYALPIACVAVLPVNDDCARYTSLESEKTMAPPDEPLFWLKRQRSSVMLVHEANDNAPPKLLLLLPKFVRVTLVMANEKNGTSCVTNNDAGEESLTTAVPMLPLMMDRETAVYWHASAQLDSAAKTFATVPCARPLMADTLFAGSTTVQPSASALAAAVGHAFDVNSDMHSANADRRLHVASCAEVLHADGVAALSVSRPTHTVYATVTLAWVTTAKGRAARP
jgi:hypothetical protein